MSGLDARVDEVMDILEDHISNNNMGAVRHRIRKALQEQDKITRHACAEEASQLKAEDNEVGFIYSRISVHTTIMNCQGGVK